MTETQKKIVGVSVLALAFLVLFSSTLQVHITAFITKQSASAPHLTAGFLLDDALQPEDTQTHSFGSLQFSLPFTDPEVREGPGNISFRKEEQFLIVTNTSDLRDALTQDLSTREQKALQEVYGDDILTNAARLYEHIFAITPDDISFFDSEEKKRADTVFLTYKQALTPMFTEAIRTQTESVLVHTFILEDRTELFIVGPDGSQYVAVTEGVSREDVSAFIASIL